MYKPLILTDQFEQTYYTTLDSAHMHTVSVPRKIKLKVLSIVRKKQRIKLKW